MTNTQGNQDAEHPKIKRVSTVVRSLSLPKKYSEALKERLDQLNRITLSAYLTELIRRDIAEGGDFVISAETQEHTEEPGTDGAETPHGDK